MIMFCHLHTVCRFAAVANPYASLDATLKDHQECMPIDCSENEEKYASYDEAREASYIDYDKIPSIPRKADASIACEELKQRDTEDGKLVNKWASMAVWMFIACMERGRK